MATALITGATAGIGAAFARRLAADGFDLVLVARDVDRLETTATDLQARHRIAVEVLPADLSDLEACDRVGARLADMARPIDVLVNNAGFATKGSFVSVDLTAEQNMLDVLVRATMRLTHAALPAMIERGTGSVINVSSVASFIASGTYSAAKAWVTVFSESIDAELRGTGVRVTALCPGYTHTEFHDRAGLEMGSLPEWLWLDADDVVAAGLKSVRRGRPVSVPGVQYKVLAALARYSPRPLVRRIGSGSSVNPMANRARPK
ncbi:MAG: SDR family oxidoreductase [Actinomycetes bacterium]